MVRVGNVALVSWNRGGAPPTAFAPSRGAPSRDAPRACAVVATDGEAGAIAHSPSPNGRGASNADAPLAAHAVASVASVPSDADAHIAPGGASAPIDAPAAVSACAPSPLPSAPSPSGVSPVGDFGTRSGTGASIPPSRAANAAAVALVDSARVSLVERGSSARRASVAP